LPGEVRIHVDVDGDGHYRFRIRAGAREITTVVDPDLATSFYEDLRLLRWKSVGLHNPGDVLLSNVGDRLAGMIAPPARWQELGLHNEVRLVRVQFSQAAHHLMTFPWELLRINDEFLIGAEGSHLIREAPAAAGKNRKRNPRINIVHISLGTDSDLRFDEERAALLEAVPDSIPIEFLIDPSAGHVEAVLDGFRPQIVIVSGHGHYDDLRREHYLAAGRDEIVPTAFLTAACASYGCKLLVLSTCESARLGGSVVDNQAILPADLIAFTFPVRTTTATRSIACLFQELVRGRTISEAMAAVRAIDVDDVYAFFNTVHLHRDRARSLRITDATPRPPGPPAPRCPGMELALGTLNSVAHTPDPTTLIAAVGSGGDALIQHWAALVGRSQAMAARWRVLLDGAPLLDAPQGQVVRLAYTHSYVPLPAENLLYSDGMDREFAQRQLAERDEDLARRMAKHPLLGMPGFVQDLCTGHTEQDAVERFERENRMVERAARLSRDGIIFASWLFTNESYVASGYEDRAAYAETIKDFGMTERTIVAGIENAVAAGVLLVRPDSLLLAPEFMLLGDRWFPNWRTDHRTVFRMLCGAVGMLAAHGKMDPEKDSRILDWAIRLEDWEVAPILCITVCRWYGEHGRLDEMKDIIEQVFPHAAGMEHIILRGHLVTIATNQGDYRSGLIANQQIEADLEALRDDTDYPRNKQATITQQIDCLIELGRFDEAEQRWRDAHDLIPRLDEYQGEAEARLLGQLAHLRREQEADEDALAAATRAVQVAIDHDCSPVLVAELRHTKADLLRREGRDREAVAELNAMVGVPMSPGLRSRFLHLKALLLERYNAPDALEHFLESYQHDLLRGDEAGVAISLLAIARIYFDEHEYDRARERIREAMPLANKCGLVNVVASLSFLWAEIDLAEGKNTSAATWLITARQKFAEDQDEGGVENATRLLDRLQAER
jgi:tetratricopeptide (TPR) repeat protein